jgi:hypothetical protein
MKIFFPTINFLKGFKKILKARKTKDHTNQLSKGANKIFVKTLARTFKHFLRNLDWLI